MKIQIIANTNPQRLTYGVETWHVETTHATGAVMETIKIIIIVKIHKSKVYKNNKKLVWSVERILDAS